MLMPIRLPSGAGTRSRSAGLLCFLSEYQGSIAPLNAVGAGGTARKSGRAVGSSVGMLIVTSRHWSGCLGSAMTLGRDADSRHDVCQSGWMTDTVQRADHRATFFGSLLNSPD